MDKHITHENTTAFAATFETNPKHRLAMNAVTKNGIGAVALNRAVVNRIDHTYSELIKTPKATHQKKSGRCWLFAGLNTLRLQAMENMNLEEFELSQAYLLFWDKLEKANYFLESIIETRDEPLDGRLVMWILANPVVDGGQWDMFTNLVKKYGVVPKSAMPETESSSNTRPMNGLLLARLREDARTLRDLHAGGASLGDLRARKEEMMEAFYRMLSIHLGTPPHSFFWEWRDKDEDFHRHGDITPQAFFETYVRFDLDDAVCLINAPTLDKPFETLYTVQFLGNVVGGQIVTYLNVDIATLKRAAVEMIKDGNVVWFGCDVGKWLERKMGIMDPAIYDYDLVYDVQFELDKAERLDYGQSRMTHAMVLTGVDLDDDGQPIKWRVENSWGTDLGDEGYMLMTDAWFDEFVYELTVSKAHLVGELLEVLETEPVVLPPWDPMGALAAAA